MPINLLCQIVLNRYYQWHVVNVPDIAKFGNVFTKIGCVFFEKFKESFSFSEKENTEQK